MRLNANAPNIKATTHYGGGGNTQRSFGLIERMNESQIAK